MLRGRVFVALAWLALVGATQPIDNRSGGNTAANQSQTNTANETIVRELRGIRTAIEAQGANSYSEEERKHAQEDLEAQQKAADWTKYTGIFALIGVIISVVGVALVFGTFQQTLRTAEAAVDANKIARDTAQRQLRAYVEITKMGIRNWEAGKTPTIGYEIDNVGQTPALDLQVYAQAFFFPADDNDKRFRFKKRIGQGSTTTLARGSPLLQDYKFTDPFNQHQFDKINGGGWSMYFVAVLRYRDIFKKRHWTICKSEYLPDSKPVKPGVFPLYICSDGNRSN